MDKRVSVKVRDMGFKLVDICFAVTNRFKNRQDLPLLMSCLFSWGCLQTSYCGAGFETKQLFVP